MEILGTWMCNFEQVENVDGIVRALGSWDGWNQQGSTATPRAPSMIVWSRHSRRLDRIVMNLMITMVGTKRYEKAPDGEDNVEKRIKFDRKTMVQLLENNCQPMNKPKNEWFIVKNELNWVERLIDVFETIDWLSDDSTRNTKWITTLFPRI